MKKVLAMLLAVTMSLSLVACGGKNADGTETMKKVNMKVSIGVPESHFEYKALEEMREYVLEATDGTLDMLLFPSAQIGNDQEVFESLPLGIIQMVPCGVDIIANFIPEFGMLSLPWLFDSQEEVSEITGGEWGQELLDKLEDIGYVGLGFGDFGFRHTTNNKRPIETMEDFKGIKIRTMTNPVHLQVFETLGANPTPMAFSELFSALQQGVVDGQENPLMNIYSNKLHEVQKYLTLDEHVYTLVTFVVGKEWFDELHPQQQQALEEGVKIAQDYMRKSVVDEDNFALEEIKKSGVQVNELTPEAKKEMIDATQGVRDQYGNRVNKEFYNELLESIKELRN